MIARCQTAQIGVITDPDSFVEYLTFTLRDGADASAVTDAIGELSGIQKSIKQKDTESGLTLSVGISANAWEKIFPEIPRPAELRPFPALQNGDRQFPASAGDIFVIVESHRMDLNFQAAKYVANGFAETAILVEDIQSFKYLDNRDMIDFVDGTENPQAAERLNAVLVADDIDIHQGGSYLTVQRYVHKTRDWDAQATTYQEQVIGRTKMDNIELDDDKKPAWAHNNKSKVEKDGQEIAMLRQNRPYGNAMEHGTMFVGFAASPSVIETSLQQMITADENGDYDRLLDFVEAKTGAHYFMPSRTLLDSLGED